MLKQTLSILGFAGKIYVLWIIAFAPAISAQSIYKVYTPDGWQTGSTQEIWWDIDRDVPNSLYCNFSYASSNINITLHDELGKTVAQIASNIDSDCWAWKYRLSDSVIWTVPTNLEDDQYRIMLHTTDGIFTGQSDLFRIFTNPPTMESKPDVAGRGGSGMTKIPFERYLPPGGQPLRIDAKIQKIIFDEYSYPVDLYGSGERGAIGKLDVVLEVKANRPFTFGDPWDTGTKNPAASWSMADLELTIAGYVTASPYLSDYCLRSDCREFQNDPTGSMGYRKVYKVGRQLKHTPRIIPEGKSTVTLTLFSDQILFFHGVDVVGQYWDWPKRGKCLKHFDPELGVNVRLTVRMPITSEEGYGSLESFSPIIVPFVKTYYHPNTVLYIDTFLQGKDLGFLPNWGNTPVIYSWYGDEYTRCDIPIPNKLIGGW